jgi:hypothetical protein
MKKQIEEMAKLACPVFNGNCKTCPIDFYPPCPPKASAERLYNAGYRKQIEGEWYYPPYAPFGGNYEMKRCSVCGYKPDFVSDNPYTKFCPNCGAKMKGGAE